MARIRTLSQNWNLTLRKDWLLPTPSNIYDVPLSQNFNLSPQRLSLTHKSFFPDGRKPPRNISPSPKGRERIFLGFPVGKGGFVGNRQSCGEGEIFLWAVFHSEKGNLRIKLGGVKN